MLNRSILKTAFEEIFDPGLQYRATGCTLIELSESKREQINLFAQEPEIPEEKVQALYEVLKENRKVDFAASLYRRQRPSLPPKALPHFAIPMLEIQN